MTPVQTSFSILPVLDELIFLAGTLTLMLDVAICVVIYPLGHDIKRPNDLIQLAFK